jgi:hypothetical protein
MTQPLSDIPPVEEPILGGDVRSIFRPDETKLDKAKGLADAGLSLFGALVHGVPAQFMGKMGPEFQAKRFRIPETEAGKRYFDTAAEALGTIGQAFPMQPTAFTSPANILAGPAMAQAGAKAADVNAMAQRALQAAGGRLEKAVEKQVYSTMEKGGLPAEILQGMTQNTASQVVKGKGGNWIERTVEQSVKPLKSETIAGETPAQRIPRHEELLKDPTLTPESRQTVERMLGQERQRAALDNWIDRNLVNYVKKEMGTPEDPVRKLAEEGVTHKTDLAEEALVPEKSTRVQRHMAGFPASGMGQSDLAKRWENLSDEAIASRTAGDIQRTIESLPFAQEAERRFKDKQSEIARRFDEKLRNSGIYSDKEMEVLNQKTPIGDKAIILQDNEYETLQNEWWKSHGMMDRINLDLAQKNPWVMKLDPNTPLYTTTYGDLGFDHVVDVLREDLQTGRIRPEQLNKVSIEQAVRRTYEYDQEKAKEAARAAIQQQEGLPVVKDYPEGYKWLELHNKTDAKKTEEALSYEGKTMGHCVGSYCPDVLEGNTQIFSLRDSKGEPHVTIEVRPSQWDWNTIRAKMPKEEYLQLGRDIETRLGLKPPYKSEDHEVYNQALQKELVGRFGEAPSQIIQIKGKGNQAPKEDYLPFVQDFVKSQEWIGIGDIRNAGMIDILTDRNIDGDFRNWLRSQNLSSKDRYITEQEFETVGPTPFNQLKRRWEKIQAEEGDELLDKLGVVKKAEGGLVSNADTIKARLIEQGMPEDKAFMQALKLANEVQMAKGGLAGLKNLPAAARAAKSKYAEEAAAAGRAAPRSKQEIESIAQRIAEQTQPGFVRPDPAFSVNPEGKSRAVYEMEQRTPMIVESTIEDKPLPTVDYEKQLGSVIVGVPGDPTMGQVKSPGSLYEPTRAGKRLMQVGDVTPETPVELYGGPSYGTAQPESYWASSKGAAQGIKNLVDEMAEKYQTDKILGQYMKMSPESSRYAMHNLDALISVLKPDKLPADKMEILNKMVREGDKANKYPQFVGFEDPIDLLLQAQMNPNLRKRISEVLEKPTTAKAVGFPFQGSIVQTAITEPGLRNLETGVTGYSVGQMRPQGELTLSRHPTYEYDIPGQLMGRSKYPIPYELAFPDFSQWFREHPELAKKVDPFNMLKSVGARQKVDPQYVDEIKMYEEAMKRLTGKKKGGLAAVNRK